MDAGHEIAMKLRSAYWSMHRQADGHLSHLGVTADQFVLLSILVEQDGITQQELVRRAASDPNTVRAMLVLLEGGGLVERRPHPLDRRARCVTLTPRGRQTHRRLWQASDSFRAQLAGLFDADEVDRLLDALDRISQAMSGVPQATVHGTA